ncbi:MAG: T9SS type A sorting domain-containing protein [Bacteroidia bacterium]|nr:T9SS type A sorting domain-containing protein [Bacteroidia bacterium]MCF8426125.1 T9SS type A sorting domain-containing protein [Bacteroidia bacterium]MCF8446501.1 T9SS type A sorting domain-containing protein [Bacteroidia bacterium]
MKKKSTRNYLKFSFLAILIGISGVTYTNQSGAPAGNTNAPSESNCTGCHTGSAISSGTAHSSVSLTGLPAGGYSPGTTYTLTLSGSSAATSKNGFQLTALNSSNGAAGSFTSGTGSQTMVSSGRSYIGHSSGGTSQSSWTFSWTAPNPAAGAVTFYLSLNATNSNSGTSGDAVYVKTFSVSPGNLPVATINSPSNAAVFCAGDSIQFTGSGTNSPVSYAWDFLGNFPNNSTLQNPKIKFTNAGFYTIRFRATNTSGTSPNAQITIQVLAKPTASITPSGPISICGNDSATLTANAGSGLSYLWSPGNQTTQSIKVGAAGAYSVKVSNAAANCFANSNSITASVSPKPTVSATLSSNSLCIGDTIEIVATPGLQSYKYYFGSTLMDSSSNSTMKFPITTSFSTIFVVGSNGSCNSDPDIKAVSISTKPGAPIISCGPVNPNFVSFTISGTNPEISLDSGKTYITPNQGSSHLITGLSPNTEILAYARNATSAPCLYSLSSNKSCASANCTPLTLSIIAPKTVCSYSPSSEKMMRVISTNAVNPYFKFDYPQPFLGSGWTKLDSFPILNSPSSGNLLHKITVIDSANSFCPTKDTSFNVYFANFSGPTSQLTTNKPNYCKDDEITFNVSAFNSIINRVYYYTVDGSNLTEFARRNKPNFSYGPVSINPNFLNGTQIGAKAEDTLSGCAVFTAITTLIVSDKPTVGFTFSKTNLEIVLTDTTNNNVRRNWIIEGDTFATNNQSYTHTFTTAGTKTIQMDGFTSGDCMGSASKEVTISATGILESANSMGMQLFPNPARNEVSINWNKGGNGTVELWDINGKLILNTEFVSGNKLDLSGISKGIYVLKLSSQDQSAYKKLIVE